MHWIKVKSPRYEQSRRYDGMIGEVVGHWGPENSADSRDGFLVEFASVINAACPTGRPSTTAISSSGSKPSSRFTPSPKTRPSTSNSTKSSTSMDWTSSIWARGPGG